MEIPIKVGSFLRSGEPEFPARIPAPGFTRRYSLVMVATSERPARREPDTDKLALGGAAAERFCALVCRGLFPSLGTSGAGGASLCLDILTVVLCILSRLPLLGGKLRVVSVARW